MSTFTLTYPIKTETSGTNQKHLILSDTTIQGAQVNPAIEYVENYVSTRPKGVSGSNIEMHNNVIYYPKIYTSTLTLIVNNYFDDSSEDLTQHKYVNPYTEYYIINPSEYYCRKLSMTGMLNSNADWQEVTIDLRSNEVQTQIGSSSSGSELLRDQISPKYYAMVAAVFDPNKSGEYIRLQNHNSNGDISTNFVEDNSFDNFNPGDGKYVDIMRIGLLLDEDNHLYKFYYHNASYNSISVIKLEEEMK